MCGIAGYLSANLIPDLANNMAQVLSHRGPDSQSIWEDDDDNIAFAHSRLAIRDLTSAGAQPMISSSGRYVIVFNGEIYNHNELRESLKKAGAGISWSGGSDTETLLEGLSFWGVEVCVSKLKGMFSFALWDKYSKQLTLARDRFGEKPLYYGIQGGSFIFGSELKALKLHPNFENKISKQALGLYFRLNYIPTPLSIYERINKLEPGTISVFSKSGQIILQKRYWSIEETANKPRVSEEINQQSYIDKLDSLINKSVSSQMVSDVPIGAFLSGGIDSSTIVANLQKLSEGPIKTFTIGFEDPRFNESDDARIIADYLGTDHKELIVSPAEAITVIDKLAKIYDEPFSDASQIPTYLVSLLAREDVTVCLSGDGGDELFCGYNRYHYTVKVWGLISKLPTVLRSIISKVLLLVTPSIWDVIGKITFLSSKFPNFGYKIHKGASVIKSNSIEELYMRLVSNWSEDEKLVKGAEPIAIPMLTKSSKLLGLNGIEKMMLWDMQSYLMDDVLVKTDRATMACSLEGRIPFLDHEIAQFSATIPFKYMYQEGKGKWILRQVLYKYIPRELVERPKQGFSLPISEWLRGPLKGWASGLLDPKRLETEGYLDPNLVNKKWQEHLLGKSDWSSQLWSVLMFQLWLESNQ